MNITLIYFDFPFWRAEVSRIALFMGGVDFNDRRIGSEEFQRVKANGYLDDGTLMPFRQCPVLVVDGISIAQTGAIARLCGKLANLYPNNNNTETNNSNFVDFLSNGFKLRTTGTAVNACTIIYMAFAEQPGTTPFDTFANSR